MKRILLTGANGFIAHHLVRYFLKFTDFEIYAHYRSSSSNIPNSDRIHLFQMDLNNTFPSLPKFDYIVHTAANTVVSDSLKDCIPFIKNNVLATGNLLEWIKKKQYQSRQ